MNNELFDIIIIGASQEGLLLAEQLSKISNLKTLLVSKSFPKVKSTITEKIHCIKGEVIYATYLHGILGVHIAAESNKQPIGYFSKRIVIATGSKPEKLTLKTDKIYYNKRSITDISKKNSIIMLGNSIQLTKDAIELSKKFGQIYICYNEADLDTSEEINNKLTTIKNIIKLPLCTVIACMENKANNTIIANLNTFENIECSGILAYTQRTPDIPVVFNQFIKLTDGKITVNKLGQATTLPVIYAVGACATNASKAMISRVAETLEQELR